MLDKPTDLWCKTRLDGTVRVEYILFVGQQNGLGIVMFGIVEGSLQQITGKLVRKFELNEQYGKVGHEA